jgi:cytochrome P450
MSTAAVDFDPFSEEWFEDPTEIYRRLRDEAPVFYSERYGFYAVSRFADVAAAHRNSAGLTSTRGLDLSMMRMDPEELRGYRSIILMDPPEHDQFRALVSRVFTPKAVAALEPMVREVINGVLEPLENRDEFDAVVDFSAPFPVEIISRMLGVPPDDRQAVRQRLDLTLHRDPGDPEPNPEGQRAAAEGGAYFYRLVLEKRRNPADDMLTQLTQVEVDRGDGETTRLDDGEIAGFAGLLGGAGAETVTKLVGNAFVLFSRYPEQWKKLIADPSLLPQAVEEILRFLPPSQYQGRFSTADVDFTSGTIPAGYPVFLVTGAATRDPRAFERPDEFDITRTSAMAAIGFGFGVHFCLGAALARMESRIALEEMMKRWRSFEIDEAGLRRVHMSNVAGFANVPVTVRRHQR